MADILEEIGIEQLLQDLIGSSVFLNPLVNSGILEEIHIEELLQDLTGKFTFFVPLFTGRGILEEIGIEQLLQDLIGNSVFLNPLVNSGALGQIKFTGVQGMPGDTLSLIEFETDQLTAINRQRRIKLISVI